MLADQFFLDITLPTAKEYVINLNSQRRAYLAAITTFHVKDYLKAENVINIEKRLTEYNDTAFNVVQAVANGVKHFQFEGFKNKNPIKFSAGSDFYAPPSYLDELYLDTSFIGDYVGGIIIPLADNEYIHFHDCIYNTLQAYQFCFPEKLPSSSADCIDKVFKSIRD